MVPPLLTNYHTLTCGSNLLEIWEGEATHEDFLAVGQEPRAARSIVIDTPDCAGLTNGEVYPRGGIRWEITATKYAYFGANTYPILSPTYPYPVLYANPQAHAAAWLTQHLTGLPTGASTASWNSLSLTSAAVNAEGSTDNDYAIVTYKITGTQA